MKRLQPPLNLEWPDVLRKYRNYLQAEVVRLEAKLGGWVRGADGLPQVREGILKLREQGSLARMPYWLSLLADVLARAGEPDLFAVTSSCSIMARAPSS